MMQFIVGFTLGNVVGMYLAQNYEVPNIAKKIEAFKKTWRRRKSLQSEAVADDVF